MPIRIQRKRVKGWKMPPNTVYVGRPTRFGNPYKVGELSFDSKYPVTAEQAVGFYAKYMIPYTHKDGTLMDFCISEVNLNDIKAELKGKNLACWCKIGDPCHADLLLRLANE